MTLIFGILRFAHFAHGDMMTLGAFVAFVLAGALPPRSASTPSGRWLHRAAARDADHRGARARASTGPFYAPLRARGAKPVTLLIASIGVTLMIQGLIRLFFGVEHRSFFDTEPKDDLPHRPAVRRRPGRSSSPSRRCC